MILMTAAFVLSGFQASAQWVTAYYINTTMFMNDLPWSKATHIVDLGLYPTDNFGDITGIAASDADAFTSAAHANGVKALLCVRDANGNLGAFGASISNNLNGFVANIVNFVNAHNYDGVDLDWEAGNYISGGDDVRYTNLITALRTAMGSSKIITMSVYWNVGMARVVQNSNANVNQINLMCYDMDQWNTDIYFNSATNLAAGDTTHASCATHAALFATVAPRSKIGLGLPFYGRVWSGCANSSCSDGLHSLLQGWSSQSNTAITYAALVGSSYWAQPHGWDPVRGSSFISIDQAGASNDRFISFTDSQQINAMAQLMRSQGYGGLMEYEVEYDFMPSQSGDARHPLATAVWSAVFGSTSSAAPPPPVVSAPVVGSGAPSGTLSSSTTQTMMSVATNQNATCKYATSAGVGYASMPSTFSSTGGTSHSTSVAGLSSGNTYSYFIKCATSGVADASDYQVSFSVAKPAISSSVALTPASGSGYSQTFSEQVVDSSGTAALTQVDLIIGQIGPPNTCWAEYSPASKTMFLHNDDNTWLSAPLGSSTILENNECSVNPATSSVATAGAGTQLTVNFAMSFKTAYVGPQSVITFVADNAGWVTGFVNQGTYTVTAPPVQVLPGLHIQVTPASGSGNTAKFVIKATDSAGFQAIQQLDLFIGNNLGGTNQCYVDYEAQSRTVYLLASDNSHWMPATPGSPTQLQNNVCSIHMSSVMVVGSGSTLMVTIPVTFIAPQYLGNRGVLYFGADSKGISTGWQSAGTWTVTR